MKLWRLIQRIKKSPDYFNPKSETMSHILGRCAIWDIMSHIEKLCHMTQYAALWHSTPTLLSRGRPYFLHGVPGFTLRHRTLGLKYDKDLWVSLETLHFARFFLFFASSEDSKCSSTISKFNVGEWPKNGAASPKIFLSLPRQRWSTRYEVETHFCFFVTYWTLTATVADKMTLIPAVYTIHFGCSNRSSTQLNFIF